MHHLLWFIIWTFVWLIDLEWLRRITWWYGVTAIDCDVWSYSAKYDKSVVSIFYLKDVTFLQGAWTYKIFTLPVSAAPAINSLSVTLNHYFYHRHLTQLYVSLANNSSTASATCAAFWSCRRIDILHGRAGACTRPTSCSLFLCQA